MSSEINNKIMYQLNEHKNSSHKLVVECIETAFFELMANKNYNNLTITEIIKKAGVSRMGFYRNFAKKEDIVEYTVFRCFNETIKEIQSKRELDFSFKQVIETSLTKLKENSQKMKLLLDNNLSFLIYSYYEKAFNMLYKSSENSRIKQYSTSLFLGELFALEITWLQNGLVESPKKLAEMYYRLLKLRLNNKN